MNAHGTQQYELKKWKRKLVFIILFIVMAFSGFGQMPIFKRYYIADSPGMGWAADFYLTHYIHYLCAIFLLGFFAYVVTDYLVSVRKRYLLTPSAYVRIAILGCIVGTGIFRVLKNLPDVVFSPGFTMFTDISHLVFMMAYLAAGLIFIIFRLGWIKEKITS
jgi:hypothetical protein